ncbi:hypothetical protein DF186_16110, partial [Enterococcus hirae]
VEHGWIARDFVVDDLGDARGERRAVAEDVDGVDGAVVGRPRRQAGQHGPEVGGLAGDGGAGPRQPAVGVGATREDAVGDLPGLARGRAPR